jgi:Zn-dependent protease
MSPVLNPIVYYLLYVNMAWGFLNLLLVYPRDGGQLPASCSPAIPEPASFSRCSFP